MKKMFVLLVLPLLTWSSPASNADITGVWRLKAASWEEDTKQFADCEIIKFITKTRWASLFIRNGNEFVGSGGGTYSYHNGHYIEKVEYSTWDAMTVGSEQKFTLKIENGLLIQEGLIKTDHFNSKYYAVLEKLEEISRAYDGQISPQGVWQLAKATYGDSVYPNMAAVQKKYGEAIKIITPTYFLGTFFDSNKKTFEGLSFGSYLAKGNRYTETVKVWGWEDQTVVGTQPSFLWEITSQDHFKQHGELNSAGSYSNYRIEEEFIRIEPLEFRPKP